MAHAPSSLHDSLARAAVAWLVACTLSVGACLPDADYKHRGPTVPAELHDGWEIATAASVGLDPNVLADIHDELLREDRHFGTLGFLVIKDGKLVFETYLRSQTDRDHIHALQSVTKSFTSLALGIARGEGLFPDLDATLQALVPEQVGGLDPRKNEITLEDLLTMRSGIAFDNDDFSIEMWVGKPKHPFRYMLDKPLYADPGERFYYRDADPQILGYVLQYATGESEEAWLRERMFEPLGIEDYYWESGHDGASQAAHGLHLRPRDLAKLGQLMLDDCAWKGEVIVPSEWCKDAARTHVSPEQVDERGGFGYGYYFWTLPDDAAYAAWGHGGQFVLVIPAQRLVLVQIARPDSDDLHGSRLEQFVQLTAPLWQ